MSQNVVRYSDFIAISRLFFICHLRIFTHSNFIYISFALFDIFPMISATRATMSSGTSTSATSLLRNSALRWLTMGNTPPRIFPFSVFRASFRLSSARGGVDRLGGDGVAGDQQHVVHTLVGGQGLRREAGQPLGQEKLRLPAIDLAGAA